MNKKTTIGGHATHLAEMEHTQAHVTGSGGSGGSAVGEKETRAVLAAISLAYPGRFKLEKSQIELTVELWQGLLSDLPEGDALKACRALVASREHPPSISEIRSEALSVRLGEGRLAAGEAWGEVAAAMGSRGRENPPEWSSAAITMAVRAAGGWWHLCTSRNATADRAKFVDYYAGLHETLSREVLSGKAPSIKAALELRFPSGPALKAFLQSKAKVSQISTVAEVEELYGKNSQQALDVVALLGRKLRR